MRTLVAGMLACVALLQAQDARLLKLAVPDYAQYSQELAADFDAANATLTLSVMANGKPLALINSTVPLPWAVVMALKESEFRPAGEVPHGRPDAKAGSYEVTLTVPIRQTKGRPSPLLRMRPGIAKGNLIAQVRPEYPEFARYNRIQGPVNLEAVISKQGFVESVKTSSGPFPLIEAAYDAVKQWQWRPYFLNGEPVEVVTDLEVGFN